MEEEFEALDEEEKKAAKAMHEEVTGMWEAKDGDMMRDMVREWSEMKDH